MDKLVAMMSYRRVVEARSFAAAARQLGISSAAVSKQISALEEQLGARLLHRSTRSVVPTEIGARYYERCVTILEDVSDAEAAVNADTGEPRGWVRVGAPMSFGIAHLGPVLAAFHRRHPLVSVEMSLSDGHINPTVEGVDVLIRITRDLNDSDLTARRLGTMDRVLCAAPAYLEARGMPASVHDLERHDCVLYAHRRTPSTWELETDAGIVEVPIHPCVTANNSLMLRDAVVDGIGIAVIPTYIVARDLAAGRLVAVLPEVRLPRFTIYALFAPKRARTMRVTTFVDFVADSLERDAEPITPN